MKLQRYANYEKPDGWSRGEPEVLVAARTISKLGLPVVNYPSLHQYLVENLSIPVENQTRIRLHGSVGYGATYGRYAPFSGTIHVNAAMAEKHLARKGGAMAVIGHEGKHRADFCNHRAAMGASMAGRITAIALSYELGMGLAELPGSQTVSELLPYVTLLGVAALTQLADPIEIRARREEKRIAGFAHETDILFPNSPRTELLWEAGGIPLQVLRQLGEPYAGPESG